MNYIADFRKSYISHEEFTKRKDIFKAYYLSMEAHNQDPERSFDMGLNKVSDWT